MCSLLLIWLSICQFTVDSKDKVLASGDVPAACVATYSNTYRKGQLTADNSATLTLQGLTSVAIDEVIVYMRSNTSSGSGSLSLEADRMVVWQIADASFDSKAWNDCYSTDYVPIRHIFTPALACSQLTLSIAASRNSLYIERYVLVYHTVAAQPYQVDFQTAVGSAPQSLQEAGAGMGILLPEVAWQHDLWHFVGWTHAPQSNTTITPAYYRAGTRFYPTSSTTLYALFSNSLTGDTLPYAAPVDDGAYLLADYSLYPDIFYPVPAISDTSLASVTTLSEAADLRFYLYFLSDSVAVISELEPLAPQWTLRRAKGNTFYLIAPDGRGLSHVMNSRNELIYQLKPTHHTPFCFVSDSTLAGVQTPIYTATPSGAAVPAVPSADRAELIYTMPMGNYRLYIYSDGRKELKKNGTFYFHKQNAPHTQ